MQKASTDLITLKQAAELLGVTLSTVSYYVRTRKLRSVDSDRRTAHRKMRQLVERSDVLQLKKRFDSPQPATPAALGVFPDGDTGA
jgi:predicted transcriptional regulator